MKELSLGVKRVWAVGLIQARRPDSTDPGRFRPNRPLAGLSTNAAVRETLQAIMKIRMHALLTNTVGVVYSTFVVSHK